MNDLARETNDDQNGEGQPTRSDGELVPADDDAGDLQSILDELFPAGAQDENLQPALQNISARIEQGEDLTYIRTLLLSVRRQWSGPLPSPEHLAAYEAALQGLANRIVSMWERQQAHRMQMESSGMTINRKIVIADIIQSYLGTVFGFIFAMAFLAAGAWLISKGHRWFGLPLGLIPPGIIFTMFAYRFLPRSKNRRDESEDTAEDE